MCVGIYPPFLFVASGDIVLREHAVLLRSVELGLVWREFFVCIVHG